MHFNTKVDSRSYHGVEAGWGSAALARSRSQTSQRFTAIPESAWNPSRTVRPLISITVTMSVGSAPLISPTATASSHFLDKTNTANLLIESVGRQYLTRDTCEWPLRSRRKPGVDVGNAW